MVEDEDYSTIINYGLPSKILFKVTGVTFKAVRDYEEVFAEFVLVQDSEEGEGEGEGVRSRPEKAQANCFKKVLSNSDASEYGGCCLPKADVDKVFLPLDVRQEQASHWLTARDLHGETWKMEHVYRGIPRRHMLVNGWKDFASAKQLKAGDTCVFIRGLNRNEIYIGVRRAVRMHKESADLTGYAMRLGVQLAASSAMNPGFDFHVIYNPRMCSSSFIVPYDKVMEALRANYLPGLRFETLGEGGGEDPEQSSKKYSGIIIARGDINPARWPDSEWRCLKVRLDVSSSSDVFRRLSPWEIRPLALDMQTNNQSGGLPSQILTHSVFEIDSSSRQHEP